MNKKDYIKIAAALKNVKISIYKEDLLIMLADLFKQDNPRFNEDKFREACQSIYKE